MARLLALAALLPLVACSDGSSASDGGAEDADAGVEDPKDVGSEDEGAEDAGQEDAEVARPCVFAHCLPEQPLRHDSPAQLERFFSAHGGRDAFPIPYVRAVEGLIAAEDALASGDRAEAQRTLDAIFSRQPVGDPTWWQGVGQDGTNVGTPVAYYGLRMVDAILRAPEADRIEPLQMTVVLATCAEGTQPSDPDLEVTQAFEGELHPDLSASGYGVLRTVLQLFGFYMEAVTDGRRRLSVAVQAVDDCIDVDFGWVDASARVARAGPANYGQPLEGLTEEVLAATDFFWVIYPSNVPDDSAFDNLTFISGGMGAFGQGKPVFISDDLWLVRKPPHLGEGPMSDIERRVYLPQWLQHEFFHHLFSTWPDFGLEASSHQWFDRSTWPDDFNGEWEPDYYAEALQKRLRSAEPPPWQALKRARPIAEQPPLTRALLVGRYERIPTENGWHRVQVGETDEGLQWANEADSTWGLELVDGRLRSKEDCPYGVREVSVEFEAGAVVALWFLGERYARQ